tara:strand:- start:55 stop:216 length:162 start_codon:yes stop_codon:yes gene_type:complete
MKFKYKSNYFLAIMGGGIEFDSEGNYEAKNDTEIQILEELGAVKVEPKKTTKK